MDRGFSKSYFDGIWSLTTDVEQVFPINGLRFYPEQETFGKSGIHSKIYFQISYFKDLYEMEIFP